MAVHIIFDGKRTPAFSLFTHTVLTSVTTPPKEISLFIKAWHIMKDRNITITESFAFLV